MAIKGEIVQLNTPYGRFYQTPDGVFPSVTSVLSTANSPGLDAWRESVGHDVAEKIAKKAAATGTRLHSYCEDYLKGLNPKLDIFDSQIFKSINYHLDLINPVLIEKPLWSKRLRVAGTIDCFGTYNKKLSIIDFKTSRQEKWPGEFDTYWMQTAAYASMIEEHTGRKISNLVIIMQNTSLGQTNIFSQDADDWIHKFEELRSQFQGEYRG